MITENQTPIADLTFLVAEDDEVQRWWLTVVLGKLGATHIVEADNGLAALAILQDKQKPIDVAFVDLNMPDIDAIELVRHLAKVESRTALVLTSALGSALLFSAETVSKAYGINLLGTFEQPASPEILQNLLASFQPSRPLPDRALHSLPEFTLDDIRAGLQDGQFEPFFQPKVELATGKVKGVEAFVRWRHPQFGPITPDAFMPALEAGGHMEELTWLVIEKVIAACRVWHDRAQMLTVSINLSPTSLAQPELVEKVLSLTARHGVEPEYVTFEITESIAMTEVQVCLENLARLRIKGFGLAVDDYGTAHSSMQQLLRIPFLDLKIDRSFVAGAARNKALRIVLASSLELARKLQRNSVAVGVESREDWDLLRDLGCIYAQGYYIAKPMERDVVSPWIDEWSHFF